MTNTGMTIQRVTLIEYQPARPKESASDSMNANVLVTLTASGEEGELAGIGECQLRRATGDDHVASWDFLLAAAEALEGVNLVEVDQSSGVAPVRQVMSDLADVAVALAPSDRTALPFRGAMLGLETALLDLVARQYEVSVADLLGGHRDQITVAPPSLSLPERGDSRGQGPKPVSGSGIARFTLTGDVGGDLHALKALAGRRSSRDTVWWLDARAALDYEDAERMLTGLVAGMRRAFPRRIILEQPIGASQREQMADLQRLADQMTTKARRRDLDLRIMADEGLTTSDHLARLVKNGGCRGVNIKPARVGGLIPAVDLAREATEHNADMTVALSSMASTSDVSFWAMHQLGLAMPRLDYFVRTLGKDAPAVTDRAPSFAPGGRSVAPINGPGLGIRLDLESLVPSSRRYAERPDAGGPMLGGQPAIGYPDERHTRWLTKPAMRSHLVEREALAHGLSTTRYNPTTFVAHGESGPPLVFGASARSPVSGAGSFVIADKHKGAAQALLEHAGVPVPEGRVFSIDDVGGAITYANRLGYPVVSKPVGGTGGAAVTTGITSDDGLAAGFEAVRQSPRFGRDDVLVQRHISGDVYRIMVQGAEVSAALMRIPPSVVGDGRRSIAELIIEKNTFRRDNPRLRKGPIALERSANYLLTHGLSLESVPTSGERVVLADDAYLNGGGDSIDVLPELHPSIAEACVKAVAAVPGLHFCGVDILLEDHRAAIDQQAAGVCELNSCPELITPQFPMFGESRPVARQLLMLAASGHSVRLANERARELAVRISVEGGVTGVGYLTWFRRMARELGLRGWVRQESDRVEAVAAGSVVPVSVLASIAISGPGRARPASVATSPADPPVSDGFLISSAATGSESGSASDG